MTGDRRNEGEAQSEQPRGSQDAPAAGVFELGDIQQRGLHAAGQIVQRLVAAVDGAKGGSGKAGGDGRGDEASGEGDRQGGHGAGGTSRTGDVSDAIRGRSDTFSGLPDLSGLVDLWGELAKQSMHLMVQLAASRTARRSPEDEAAENRRSARDDTGSAGTASAASATEPSTTTGGDDGVATDNPPDDWRTAAGAPVDVETAAPSVEVVLRETGRLVRRAMLDAIPDGEPHPWLYRLVRSYPSRAGKAIRPGLCLATCRAFGGRDEDALPIAVAIELLHNAFLVHDDVADGSQRRRGRPTLAAEHGPALALNAGDALAVVANQVLRRHLRGFDGDLADRVFAEFETMALRTLEGQATELGWRQDGVTGLTPEDYLGLIMHKTCWYTTIHPLRVGAMAGSGGQADIRPMVRFGFHLGAAFQIRDDLLNLVGDESVYGKEINGDLYEGKRTLMLIHLMAQARGADRTTVEEYLRMERAQRTDEVVAEVRRMMDVYGSLAFAAHYAEGIASAALDAFDAAFAHAHPGPDSQFIRDLIPYMHGRTS
jgi:geranylgeranyl diphosphate synthase type II